MSSKLRIAVVKGGPSKEHEISLQTAEAVLKHLDPNKFEVIDVLVSKQNRWSFGDQHELSDNQAIEQLKQVCHVVFLAVHGTYGEDGTLQAKLEKAGLPFTGSGSEASAKAMNKIVAQEVYSQQQLLVPRTLSKNKENYQPPTDVSFPLVVKPVSQGSSVGVGLAKSADDLPALVAEAFRHDDYILLQEFIAGREVSCGVLATPDSDTLDALPPTELRPKHAEFFDFNAKYTAGETDEITPPDMSADTINSIQQIAKTAHTALGCQGYSRTDMIVRGEQIYVIETNTLPGMTATSILPQQAKAAGLTFAQLLERIIACALERPL